MAMQQLLLSVYMFTFLTGLPTNILAFWTFFRKLQRRAAPIDVLLLNLTISDLIFLAFLPFQMKVASDNMRWTLDFRLCPITSFVFFVTIYNSTLLLTAVSVERYLGVAYPLRYSLCRRPLYATLASVTFWAMTTLNLSFVYVLPYTQWLNSSTTPLTCYHDFTEAQLEIVGRVRFELFCVFFCVPCVICSFCYINFIVILSRLPKISRRRRLRAIGLAFGTLFTFVVCFGPYNVSHVVGFVQDENQSWRTVALLLSTLNACLDPFIFYVSSAAVRRMIHRCFNSISAKLHILKCGGAAS
ncbi:free fatty acid receptor 3-like [Neosynchiropus ocellatus]